MQVAQGRLLQPTNDRCLPNHPVAFFAIVSRISVCILWSCSRCPSCATIVSYFVLLILLLARCARIDFLGALCFLFPVSLLGDQRIRQEVFRQQESVDGSPFSVSKAPQSCSRVSGNPFSSRKEGIWLPAGSFVSLLTFSLSHELCITLIALWGEQV